MARWAKKTGQIILFIHTNWLWGHICKTYIAYLELQCAN
jgi:hypothetical protein